MPAPKIKIADLINALISDALSIENQEGGQKEKTQKFKRLATSFINKMYGDQRRKESDRIAPNTARSYLTRARNAVKEKLDVIHHRFDSEINKLANSYPSHSGKLMELLDHSPEDTRKEKKSFLDALLDAKEILSKVDCLDFSKKNVGQKIENLAREYPFYHQEILTLKGEQVFNAKQSLISTLNDASKLYEYLGAVKVDHELIVNLALPKSVTDLNNRAANRSLDKKKNTKVYVNYTRYIQDVFNILLMPAERFGGNVENIAPLIFALSAVTGRRPIEIIYTGNFKIKNKHELFFSGQAKKRDDDDQERVIYSLVDTKMFIAAFELLRASSTIKTIVAETPDRTDHKAHNEVIKGKISPWLSEFTKNFFIDGKRVFKDTRGIYGRICYQRWYLNDPRWRSKDEDLFFSELFGHADVKSKTHYMPYQLENFNIDYEPNKQLANKRWEKLCELDDIMPAIARANAAVEIHNYVKEQVLENPNVVFNQTRMTTNKINGKLRSRGTIKNYLDAIGDLKDAPEPITKLREAPDEELSKVETESEETPQEKIAPEKSSAQEEKPKKSKPHVTAKLLDDELWEVIVKLDNKTKMYSLYAGDKMTAMKTAYSLFVGELFEFQVSIPFKGAPYYEQNVYANNENTAEMSVLKNARLDGYKGAHNKIKVKKLT